MPDTPDEELVRRLLADARPDEPMPAEVVARLEAALAREAAAPDDGVTGGEQTDPGVEVAAPTTPPTPLASRRRGRRRAAALLAAAAVVVVGGVTLQSLRSPASMDDATSSADSAGAAGGRSAPESAGLTVLHRATLASDVRQAAAGLRAPAASLAPPLAPSGCIATSWGEGTLVPATLAGTPVMLVLRPPQGRRQVGDVLECGTARRLASVRFPAP